MQLRNDASATVTDEINAAIRTMVDTVLGAPNTTIKSQQEVNHAAPSGEFQTVGILHSDSVGTAENNQSDQLEDIQNHSTQLVSSTYSVNFYRGAPHYRARLFRAWLYSANARIDLQRVGLGFTLASQVRNAGAALPEQWERRAQMDVTFSHVDNYIEVVRSITVFTITGTFHGNSLTKTFTTNIGS